MVEWLSLRPRRTTLTVRLLGGLSSGGLGFAMSSPFAGQRAIPEAVMVPRVRDTLATVQAGLVQRAMPVGVVAALADSDLSTPARSQLLRTYLGVARKHELLHGPRGEHRVVGGHGVAPVN